MVKPLKHEDSHVLLENADVQWYWDGYQVLRFREPWRSGMSGEDIAKEFGCNLISVALLIMDQAEEGSIRPRTGGWFGK
ncbi:hypothetical protein OXB_2994 [Bacillus sp. OxB-1]|uniref:hypothetical protein n=1 Tax=Bacillus sp. (strain OxB-1) TaxID=98228 RepID=UPI00058211BB|nr:hypothetical protein [Bacillus sp. OxB-1]BAQ11464.1 hypothetical protein OXB_2994 [Bacillus sp. OxB-1]